MNKNIFLISFLFAVSVSFASTEIKDSINKRNVDLYVLGGIGTLNAFGSESFWSGYVNKDIALKTELCFGVQKNRWFYEFSIYQFNVKGTYYLVRNDDIVGLHIKEQHLDYSFNVGFDIIQSNNNWVWSVDLGVNMSNTIQNEYEDGISFENSYGYSSYIVQTKKPRIDQFPFTPTLNTNLSKKFGKHAVGINIQGLMVQTFSTVHINTDAAYSRREGFTTLGLYNTLNTSLQYKYTFGK